MKNTNEIKLVKQNYNSSMDEYLTQCCMDMTLGELVSMRETARTVKMVTVSSMIFNAVIERDIDLIKTIAFRIDGTVPDEHKREGYANILGEAIDTVLDYKYVDEEDFFDKIKPSPKDTAIIGLAKSLVYTAQEPCGNNYMQRKQRNLAAQIVLDRTGGRKVSPTKPKLETSYDKADWIE